MYIMWNWKKGGKLHYIYKRHKVQSLFFNKNERVKILEILTCILQNKI